MDISVSWFIHVLLFLSLVYFAIGLALAVKTVSAYIDAGRSVSDRFIIFVLMLLLWPAYLRLE